MANQMIALGVRGPQMPDIGALGARMSNMMANMAVTKEKQAAVERANKFRQLVSSPGFDPYNPESIKQAQAIDPERTERLIAGSDARRKADLERIGILTKQARDQLALIDPNDKASYAALRDEIVKQVPGWGSRLPTPEQWNADTRIRTLMQADDVLSKTIAPPMASVQVAPSGTLQAVTVGGLGEPSAKEIPEYRYVPDQPQAPSPQLPAAPRADRIEAAVQSINNGAGVNDPALKDLTDEEFNQVQLRRGNDFLKKPTAAPASGELPPLTMQNAPQLIQTALQTGAMDQTHVDQLRQLVGPENAPAIDNWLQQNGVQVGSASLPGMRSAVYRPQAQDFSAPVADDGMAFGGPQAAMGQQIGYQPTGRAAQGKPPLQSPMPGSAIVPLTRVEGEAGASEKGKQDVRVVTDPKIEAGKARVLRIEKLRGEIPTALSQTQAVVDDMTDRINTIDEFLRHPNRNSIIGWLQGRVPKALQTETQADAQAKYDYITSNAVLDKLIKDRQSTQTGASPQGIISDRDLGIAATAATKLTQTGSEREQEIEMQRLRDVLYRTRQQAIEKYNNVYREVLNEDPRLQLRTRNVAPRYSSKGAQPKPTQSDIQYLRRNRSNPNVVNGFRKTFGADAFNKAMKGG